MLPVIAAVLVSMMLPSPELTTIPVFDGSRSGSPVVIWGAASEVQRESGVFRYSLNGNISAKNVSRKSILLIVVDTRVRSAKVDLHQIRENDYFFTSHVFKPSATEVYSFTLTGEGHAKAVAPTLQPRTAVARLAFAQFVDGSTWGDPTAGAEALRNRRLTLDKLNLLANIYRTEDTQQFVATLMQPSQLPTIGILQQLYNDKKNIDIVFQKLATMLREAELHGSATQHQN